MYQLLETTAVQKLVLIENSVKCMIVCIHNSGINNTLATLKSEVLNARCSCQLICYKLSSIEA